MRSPPLPVIIAAVLLALLSLLTLALPLFVVEVIPPVVLYSGVALGLAGLAATGGLWMLKKWGLWLTIVTCAINILWAAPGLAVVLTKTLSENLFVRLEERRISPRMGLLSVTVLQGDAPYMSKATTTTTKVDYFPLPRPLWRKLKKCLPKKKKRKKTR